MKKKKKKKKKVWFFIYFFSIYVGVSTHKGVNYVEIRHTSTTTKTWIAYDNCHSHVARKIHKLHQRYILNLCTLYLNNTRYINWGCTFGGVVYRVFTRMPSERYRRWLRSLLLYRTYVFRALINSLVSADSARALWASFCLRWLCRSIPGHTSPESLSKQGAGIMIICWIIPTFIHKHVSHSQYNVRENTATVPVDVWPFPIFFSSPLAVQYKGENCCCSCRCISWLASLGLGTRFSSVNRSRRINKWLKSNN